MKYIVFAKRERAHYEYRYKYFLSKIKICRSNPREFPVMSENTSFSSTDNPPGRIETNLRSRASLRSQSLLSKVFSLCTNRKYSDNGYFEPESCVVYTFSPCPFRAQSHFGGVSTASQLETQCGRTGDK